MENSAITKIVELIKQLQAKSFLNDYQIMKYAQWSGRLAGLGILSYISDFFQKYTVEEINTHLKKRINEGITRISNSFGEYLAVEIFTVQDFVCFVNHAPVDFICDDVKQLLGFWVRIAETQDLDEEAAETLESFLGSYSISEEDQLDIVSVPLTKETLDFWDEALEPITEIIAEKSEALEGKIHIERVDDANNESVVKLCISGVDIEDVSLVRIQGVPGIRSGKDSDMWTLDFTPFGIVPSTEDKVVVQMFDGCRAEIPYEYISRNVTLTSQKSSVTDNTNASHTKMYTMAAAESDKPVHLLLKAVETDIILDLYYDMSSKQATIEVYCESCPNTKSDKIDGWKVLGMKGGVLATIQNGCVTYNYTDFDVPVQLVDTVGKNYLLEELKEN